MLHKFEFDGTRIVIDVHSGAVHVVDDLVWNLLEDYGLMTEGELAGKHRARYGPIEVVEALDELKELEREGLLFSPDPGEGVYRPSEKAVVKSLCLHLAHACNLKCRYCFAGQGHFGGAQGLMAADTGRAAIDFLIERSGGRRRVEVDFFGGEPLLNYAVMKELVDYGQRRAGEKGKVVKFTLTTNALLLNEEVTGYLNAHDISVVLSLDGRQKVHDAMRPGPDGSGSYEAVLAGIKSFVQSAQGKNYYVRGTYTRHNLDFCADVLHMAGLGLDHLSVEPVVAPEDADYSIRQADLPVLFSQYRQLTRELLRLKRDGRPVDFFHFNIDLDGGPCLPKRLCGCGAGHEYLAVTPVGDIYPCHQFVGRGSFLMGNVAEGKLNSEIVDTFQNAHIYNKDGCAACWAKFYCSGGCHANAEAANGSILKPHRLGCELARKRLECAIYLKVVEARR